MHPFELRSYLVEHAVPLSLAEKKALCNISISILSIHWVPMELDLLLVATSFLYKSCLL